MNVAVFRNGNPKGEIHKADCFIVTTRWPRLDWKPTSKPVTCGFCGRKRKSARTT